MPETDPVQPITPLKAVIFRLSDCLLVDQEFDDFHKVADALLGAGANAQEALLYAHDRYGYGDIEECEEGEVREDREDPDTIVRTGHDDTEVSARRARAVAAVIKADMVEQGLAQVGGLLEVMHVIAEAL